MKLMLMKLSFTLLGGFAVFAQIQVIYIPVSLLVFCYLLFNVSVVQSVIWCVFAIAIYLCGRWLNDHLKTENINHKEWHQQCFKRYGLLVSVGKQQGK